MDQVKESSTLSVLKKPTPITKPPQTPSSAQKTAEEQKGKTPTRAPEPNKDKVMKPSKSSVPTNTATATPAQAATVKKPTAPTTQTTKPKAPAPAPAPAPAAAPPKEAAAPKFDMEDQNDIQVFKGGERVICKNPNNERELAYIRFVGFINGSSGYWYGVELDNPCGKHNGYSKGKQYYECPPMHGMFYRARNLEKIE
eukprot:TRINITY_DN8919_c0_g1_i1.p1 TRINITY_DN8919_c0_g1~~TRINITY_DN8919_c0_g1_i1.p1  ORF type:complete len:198 (+),score=44.45 TRINITY_DN8919_c0_g1_i1:133-726(+)